jgi:hypothetical protein
LGHKVLASSETNTEERLSGLAFVLADTGVRLLFQIVRGVIVKGKGALSILIFLIVLTSCGTWEWRGDLSDMKTGEAMHVHMIEEYCDQGKLSIRLPSGEWLMGRYVWGEATSGGGASIGGIVAAGGITPIVMGASGASQVVLNTVLKSESGDAISIRCQSSGSCSSSGYCEGFVNGEKRYEGAYSRMR